MSRRKKVALLGALAVALVAAGAVWNEYRTEALRDVVNPMYWVRRMRGEDLFDPRTAVLHHGNRSLHEVAITIDDGPHEPNCSQLLDIFKRFGVRATFFNVGRRMEEWPEVVRRMVADGHEVANHSQNHYRLDQLKPAQRWREMNDCDIEFCAITGRHLYLLRPPGERMLSPVLQMARDQGYVVVSSNDEAKDFLDVSPDFIVNRVLRRAENGSLILLHDERPATIAAMPRILAALQRDHYRFVTVSEMLAHLPKPVIVQTNAGPLTDKALGVRRWALGPDTKRPTPNAQTVGTVPAKSSVTVDSGRRG